MTARLAFLTLSAGLMGWAASSAWSQGLPASNPNDHYRAGRPQESAWITMPSINHANIFHWVGGGAVSRKRGEGPTADEGTFGMDYRGWLLPRRVNLLWWHKRYQGGPGPYKTDGPRLPHLHGAEHGNEHESHNGHNGTNGHGEHK